MTSDRKLGPHSVGRRHSVNHRSRQYVRINEGGFKSDTAEAFFSLINRGFNGVYQQNEQKAFASVLCRIWFPLESP
jgi:hypothetical protein